MVKNHHPMSTLTSDIFVNASEDLGVHLQMSKCVLWPRSGLHCQTIPHPVYNNKKYPHGAFLDTDACPLKAIHPLCLRQFLQVRGVNLKQKEQPITLRRLFWRALRQNLSSMDLNQWNKYRQRHQYYVVTPFDYVSGSKVSSKQGVVSCLKRLIVSQEFITTSLSAPNEVYYRALRRLKDGCIDVNTFSVHKGRRHDTKELIWIVTVEVAASLRNKMYFVRVAFTLDGNGLPAPYTYCTCEVGSLSCAHIIAVYLAVLHIHNCVRTWIKCCEDESPLTPEEILSLFPPCVLQVQRIPCRAQHLARRGSQSNGCETRELLVRTTTQHGGESDVETEDEDDFDSVDKNTPLKLDSMVLSWSCQMLRINTDTQQQPQRPRTITKAHLISKSMEDDVRQYLSQFPLKRKQQFEQDFIHELEYSFGNVPWWNSTWQQLGFLFIQDCDRKTSKVAFLHRDAGGLTLKVVYSPNKTKKYSGDKVMKPKLPLTLKKKRRKLSFQKKYH